MHPRHAGRRLLRPVTERLDALTGRIDALASRQDAVIDTLAVRDDHWERRLAERTAALEARLDALVAEVAALTPEVRALREAQAEGVAYLGRRLQDAEAPDGAPRPPVDA